MSFPTLPGKHGYPSAYPPGAFLDALRGSGWEPGTAPGSVIFTYARLELFLSAHPETYTPNHMLGPGPGRFFLVNATDGRVGVNCPGIGAPAAVAQLEVQAELGVERCVSIGTAGGFQADQEPGDAVLLTSAVRDEGTSYHYLPAGADAVPDPDLTARYGFPPVRRRRGCRRGGRRSGGLRTCRRRNRRSARRRSNRGRSRR
jgi:uridine phosphorylase